MTCLNGASTAVAALAILSGACVEVSVTGASRYVEREEKRFAVTGKPDLSLVTFDGSIEIRPWERPEVLVIVEKYAPHQDDAEQIEVVANQEGSRISVDARLRPEESPLHLWHGGRSARLIVSVPSSADVAARSGDGAIDIEGVAGRVELRSGDGALRGRELAGDVRARTGDGAIRLENVTGGLDATTGDGSIMASGTFTGVRARSGDGSVTIRAGEGSRTSGEWDITTGDGAVTLELPDGFAGELDAHTGDGRIVFRDLDVSNVTGDVTRRRRDTVRGRLGAGGGAVRIRTGDGAISLRRR
jgi:hypothetical protein